MLTTTPKLQAATSHCLQQNIYTNEPSRVLDFIYEVCSTNILPKTWESFVSNVIIEKEKLRKIYHIADNEIEPAIIKYCSSSESDIMILMWNNSKLPI